VKRVCAVCGAPLGYRNRRIRVFQVRDLAAAAKLIAREWVTA
jgi:hypothetical protein